MPVMKIVLQIAIRWAANALGLWIAGRLIGGVFHNDEIWTLLWAGLALSLINSILKPWLIMISLPFIVLSLGLFIIIINGFLVWLTSYVIQSFDLGAFEVTTFGSAVLAGLIIGLVNYVVTVFIDQRK